MALTANGSADKIVSGAITMPNAAYTWSIWYRNASVPGDTVVDQPITFGDADTTPECGFSWDHSNAVFRQAAYHQQDTGSTYFAAKLTSTLAADTWYNIIGKYDGTNLTIHLNGGAAEATTACGNTNAGTASFISLFANVSSASFDDGTLAQACLWNVALSADEIAALGKRFHPLLIRPSSILGGTDLIRDVVPFRNSWTVTGTLTVAAHAPLIFPGRQKSIPSAAAAAGSATHPGWAGGGWW